MSEEKWISHFKQKVKSENDKVSDLEKYKSTHTQTHNINGANTSQVIKQAKRRKQREQKDQLT